MKRIPLSLRTPEGSDILRIFYAFVFDYPMERVVQMLRKEISGWIFKDTYVNMDLYSDDIIEDFGTGALSLMKIPYDDAVLEYEKIAKRIVTKYRNISFDNYQVKDMKFEIYEGWYGETRRYNGDYRRQICDGVVSYHVDDNGTVGNSDTDVYFVFEYIVQNTEYQMPQGSVLYNHNKTKLEYNGENKQGEFIIPDNVTEIGENAFAGCDKITRIVIGNNVTKIGKNAFLGCHKLEVITIKRAVPPVSEDAFWGGINNNCILEVPSGCKEAYIDSWNWKRQNVKESIQHK